MISESNKENCNTLSFFENDAKYLNHSYLHQITSKAAGRATNRRNISIKQKWFHNHNYYRTSTEYFYKT